MTSKATTHKLVRLPICSWDCRQFIKIWSDGIIELALKCHSRNMDTWTVCTWHPTILPASTVPVHLWSETFLSLSDKVSYSNPNGSVIGHSILSYCNNFRDKIQPFRSHQTFSSILSLSLQVKALSNQSKALITKVCIVERIFSKKGSISFNAICNLRIKLYTSSFEYTILSLAQVPQIATFIVTTFLWFQTTRDSNFPGRNETSVGRVLEWDGTCFWKKSTKACVFCFKYFITVHLSMVWSFTHRQTVWDICRQVILPFFLNMRTICNA